jgi:hypothetical protein
MKRLFLYGGTLLTVLSLFVNWVQPRAESAFAAGQPTTWLDNLVLPTALLGTVLVFGGAILDTLADQRRARELNDLKELVFAHATRDELDRLKHDIEQLRQALLEKRDEPV